MELTGRVQNGVIVVDGNPANQPARLEQRIKFPLVTSDSPGSIRLTDQRVAEILDEEELSAGC
ncbi:hypothetical protein NA78x_005478 [Anatilimnocola sp. NA78]|uniref:hypothetical protein n=1 Tax=Anatilimnocola sp. NA78 TaxID=3415683 RepID=UPI003CE562D4